jgi:Complex I intermediate-associated protein 30 (CIA30)
MSGPFAAYVSRTLKVARDATNKGRGASDCHSINALTALVVHPVVRMEGLYQSGAPKVLFTYRSSEDIKQHVVGCDADIGGRSTTRLDLSPDDGKGRFWGNMSLEVPRGKEATMRSGYAGFRNRVRVSYLLHVWQDHYAE